MKPCDLIWLLNSFDLRLNTILAHLETDPEQAKTAIYNLKRAIFTIMAKENDMENLERELIAKI
jgi:hypothetical protein